MGNKNKIKKSVPVFFQKQTNEIYPNLNLSGGMGHTHSSRKTEKACITSLSALHSLK